MAVLDDTVRFRVEKREGAMPPQALAHAERASRDTSAPPALVTHDFRAVYDEHFAFVFRCAAHRGIPQAALDDVVQEVFIVVHRKLPEFEGRSSLRTWIASIARRVVADFVKKRGNRPAGDEPLEREPASPQASTPEALERKAAVRLLDALLEKMSDEQREVFVLFELEHLSGAEIAEVTSTNENTVWTRLRAARRIFDEGVARQRARQAREQS